MEALEGVTGAGRFSLVSNGFFFSSAWWRSIPVFGFTPVPNSIRLTRIGLSTKLCSDRGRLFRVLWPRNFE